jgi:hypothetical protein
MAYKKETVTNIYNILSLAGLMGAAIILFFLMPIIHSKFKIFQENRILWLLFSPIFVVGSAFFFSLLAWLGRKFILTRIIASIEKADDQKKTS